MNVFWSLLEAASPVAAMALVIAAAMPFGDRLVLNRSMWLLVGATISVCIFLFAVKQLQSS